MSDGRNLRLERPVDRLQRRDQIASRPRRDLRRTRRRSGRRDRAPTRAASSGRESGSSRPEGPPTRRAEADPEREANVSRPDSGRHGAQEPAVERLAGSRALPTEWGCGLGRRSHDALLPRVDGRSLIPAAHRAMKTLRGRSRRHAGAARPPEPDRRATATSRRDNALRITPRHGTGCCRQLPTPIGLPSLGRVRSAR